MNREEAKMAAYLRAQLALKHALERIDYRHDVIKPKLAEMQAIAKTENIAIEEQS